MLELRNRSVSQRTKVLIEKLLLGKFTLAEIAKITGISADWLTKVLNYLLEQATGQALNVYKQEKRGDAVDIELSSTDETRLE